MPRLTGTDSSGEVVAAPLPRPVFNAPPPAPQIPPQDRAQPVAWVEDRNAYIKAKMAAQQAEFQRQAEARRQQQEWMQQQWQAAAQRQPRIRTAFEGAQRAGQQIGQLQDLGRDMRAPVTQLMDDYRQARTPDGSSIGERVVSGLRTEIPYAEQVASTVGDTIREQGAPVFRDTAGLSLLQRPGEKYKNVPTLSGVLGGGVEGSVPTEVWMAALELVPGIGTVPDLLKAAKRGMPEALLALSRTADNIADNPKALKAWDALVRGESGKLRLPGSTKIVTYKDLPTSPSLLGSPVEAYHGTGARFTQFDEGLLDQTALYGPGVYMTDDAGIAAEYAATRARQASKITDAQLREAAAKGLRGDAINYRPNQSEAVVQSLRPRADLRILNMERPLPDELIPVYDELSPIDGEIKRGMTGAQANKALREALAYDGMTSWDAADVLDSLNQKLMQRGYDGIAHVGGIKGGKPHTVTVIFDPKNVEIVTPQTRAQALGDQIRKLITSEEGSLTPGKFLPEETPKPVTGEVLPTVNEKITSMMKDAVMLTPAQRKAFTEAGRLRQAQGVTDALKGPGSTTDRALNARAAQRGKIIPAIKPIGGQLTAPEINDAFSQIDQAFDAGRITTFEHPNATSALNLLFYGTRLPGEEKLPLNLMKHERTLLGRILGPEFADALPKTREQLTLWQKAVDIATVPRALMASLDVSAPGRQGIMLLPRNPKEWFGAWVPMIKAMGSEEYYLRRTSEMLSDPELVRLREGGLVITDVGGGKTASEEFISHLAGRFPGVRMSERGYSMYLNELRASVAKKNLRYLEKAGKATDENIAQTAGWVNHFSGQGDLGAAGEYVPTLNAMFFSPKFLVSRPQAIWDLMKTGVSKEVRWQAAQNLGAFVGAGMATLAGLKMSGAAEVDIDPRSSDFGKVRVGNTRIDFWGGFQPIARMVVQASTGKRNTGALTEDISRTAVVKRFFRGKLSPTVGVVWDTFVEKGKNFQGDMSNYKKMPFDSEGGLSDAAVRLVIPLFIQGAIDGYREGGAKGAGLSLLGGAGLGVSSYEPSETTIKKEAKAEGQQQVEKYGATVKDGKVWPNQLDEAWEKDSWRKAFSAAFPKFSASHPKPFTDLEEMKAAYVEYTLKETLKGKPEPGKSLEETKLSVGRFFDAAEQVKAWKQLEFDTRMELYRAHPDALQAARDAGIEKLGEEERKALGID